MATTSERPVVTLYCARCAAWKAGGGLETCEDTPASAFADYLESVGYIVFFSPEEPYIWNLPISQDEIEACEARQNA